jgi:hypothetical protein
MEQMSERRYQLLALAIWLLWSLMLIGMTLSGGGELVKDPDDYLRMVQVQDWLAGQSWFDVNQYRMNPPAGGDMHWSRWVDVPIASMYLLGGLFLDADGARFFAMIAVPLLLLGLLIAIVASITRTLSGQRAALLAILLLPTFPLFIRQFLPGRIDHHGWQIIMAALALWALLQKGQAKSGIIMGFALAFWMHISIEGLPFAGAFGALLGFLYFFPAHSNSEGRDQRVLYFAAAMTGFSGLFLLSARTGSELATVYCDAISWPLIAAMALVSAGLQLADRFYQRRTVCFAIAATAAILGVAVYVRASGACALDPFGNLTPLVRSFWHETITEGLPIHQQVPAIVALLVYVPLVAAFVLFISWSKMDERQKNDWRSLAMLIAFATLLSFYVQRTATVVQIFAVPAFGLLALSIISLVLKISLMPLRAVLTVVLVAAVTPLAAFIAADAFVPVQPAARTATVDIAKRPCSTAELMNLPEGRIFTTMAAGPDILFHTGHSVFVSGYHRNHRKMHDLIATMIGQPEKAYTVLDEFKADYVVICTEHFETQSYLKGRGNNFASALLSDDYPSWLALVPGFERSRMRVFRFVAPKSAGSVVPR